MAREESNGKEGSSGKKSNVDTTAQSTRRRALKVIGGAGAGSMVFPGLAVAQDDAESKSGSNPEISSDWWSGGDFDPRSDAELVAEGSSTYLSENDEAPDWFTIGENNDLKYKPHGIYKKPSSERDDDFRSTDQATIAQDAGGTELCLPTSIKIRGMTVGLEACHYGRCEWSLQACLVGCIGTGAQDDCRVGYNLSGNLAGAVNLDVWAYPVPIVQFGTTVVSGLDVEGEICRWSFSGDKCWNMDVGFDFDDENVDK